MIPDSCGWPAGTDLWAWEEVALHRDVTIGKSRIWSADAPVRSVDEPSRWKRWLDNADTDE
jgi:hypothetical protein